MLSALFSNINQVFKHQYVSTGSLDFFPSLIYRINHSDAKVKGSDERMQPCLTTVFTRKDLNNWFCWMTLILNFLIMI